MKIKKSLRVLIAILLIIFEYSQAKISSKKNLKIKNFSKNSQSKQSLIKKNNFNTLSINYEPEKQMHDIDQILSQETMPSAFCMRSLRYFFINNAPKTFNKSISLQKQKNISSTFESSFLRFVKEEYNRSTYAEEFSQDATHLIEFLELSDEMNLSVDHVYVCFRLFYNKLKSAEAVDDTVINQILKNIPFLIKKYLSNEDENYSKQSIISLQKKSEEIILSKLTDHYTEFRATPDIFITNLTKEICSAFAEEQKCLKKNKQENEYKERLRQMVIRFFELALGKIIWNPKSPEGIWNSFVGISNGLRTLALHGIIDHMDDLDDFYKSLTVRFCTNIDIFGGALPIQFFEEIEHDLENGLVFFLEAEEQDAGIKSKKEELQEHLVQAKTKALAFVKNGIFSQQI